MTDDCNSTGTVPAECINQIMAAVTVWSASTLLDLTTVAANVVSSWWGKNVKTLMSVRRQIMAAVRSAPTLLDLTNATADVVSSWWGKNVKM
jgi:hypothetical protein